MATKVTIKKYANRRLYDTSRSEDITLEQVAEMVKQGSEVQVVDAKTKEDMTAFILSQIIMENARRNNALLPVPLLHLVIRYGEGVLNEFFESYLTRIIEHYLGYKTAMDRQFQQWLDVGMGITGMAQKSMAGFNPFGPGTGKSETGENGSEPGEK